MSCLSLPVVLLALAGAMPAERPAEVKPTDGEVRKAVRRSLPFLEREGVAWMNKQGCASCHVVPFLLWSHNEARARGVAVDENKLADWTDWTLTFSRSRRAWFKLTTQSLNQLRDDALPAKALAGLRGEIGKPFRTENELLTGLGQVLQPEELARHHAALLKRTARPPEPDNDGGGLDTLSQLLLGRARDARGARAAELLADLPDLMLRWQQPDGSWKAAGQLPLQDRPRAETDEVTTMWAVLALATLEKPDARTVEGIKRAVDYLGKVKPGQSNESLIGAFLVARQFGQAERADDLRKELLGRQNWDGGWAWRQGYGSDAFATGQALYALGRAGLPASNPAVQRARAYLIGSQAEDGSWSVPSRAISPSTDETRLKKVAPIYRYWGTAWATIGLARTLGDQAPIRH
jgi:squalene-hopene/tetraprenyl-beta-curcumene cyclase